MTVETKTESAQDALSAALADAALFQALSLCFRYPRGEVQRTLDGLTEEVPQRWRAPLREGAQRMGETTEARYLQLFGSGGRCRDCESAYVSNRPAGGLFADLAGFYRAFAFPLNAEGMTRRIGESANHSATRDPQFNGDPLDHIATELSFISFLLAKEAHALFQGDTEAVEVCQHARALFLREHLGMWIGGFAAQLAEHAPQTFYAQAAALAAEVVNGSMTANPLTHLPIEPLTDCFTCPAAAACNTGEEGWA